jgi:hypothetical protein
MMNGIPMHRSILAGLQYLSEQLADPCDLE